jgi:hypothetical protein
LENKILNKYYKKMENSKEDNPKNNIIKLYELKGNNKELWEKLTTNIKNGNQIKKIINFINNKLIEEPYNELNLYLLDYIIDIGNDSIIDQIFDQDGFYIFVNTTIFHNKDNKTIQDISLYLVEKWYNRFKEKYKSLMDQYKEFKNEGKEFPQNKIVTYEKYIKIENENDTKEQNNNDKENTDNGDEIKYNALENPFEDTYENLLEEVDFPEDEQFNNQFSNLRTSDIPTYFKTLRNKSIVVEDNYNPKNKDNKNQSDFEIIDEINEEYKDSDNNNNKKEEEKKKENNNSNNKNNWSSTFINYRKDPVLFQNKYKDKISTLNKWIKEGKNSSNFENLKEGIRQILIGYDEIEEVIMACIKIEDNDGRNKVSNIKSDIEQTCYRYECLLQGKKVEKFKSAFDGNVKKYYFYKPNLLEDDNNLNTNININVIESPKSPKKEKKIKVFGRALKNGFLNLGKRHSKSNNKSKENKKDKELDNLGSLYNEG